MSSDKGDSGLTRRQKEVIGCLPASTRTIAEEYGITKSAVRSCINRIRSKGVGVLYDDENGIYLPPGDDTDIPEKPGIT